MPDFTNIQRREAKIQTRQATKELKAKNLEFVNKAVEKIQSKFKGYAAKKQLKDLFKVSPRKPRPFKHIYVRAPRNS
mgnify:CR=1 FL=1